jgi:hypothetical protein
MDRDEAGHGGVELTHKSRNVVVRLGLLQHLEARTDTVYQRNPAVNVSHHVAWTPLWCHDGV